MQLQCMCSVCVCVAVCWFCVPALVVVPSALAKSRKKLLGFSPRLFAKILGFLRFGGACPWWGGGSPDPIGTKVPGVTPQKGGAAHRRSSPLLCQSSKLLVSVSFLRQPQRYCIAFVKWVILGGFVYLDASALQVSTPVYFDVVSSCLLFSFFYLFLISPLF